MTNGFDEMILNMTDTTPEPEDYTGEDGLLYCGKCHKPKEGYFPKETAAWLGRDRHPAECDCQRAEREEREAAEKQRSHLETVERLKRRGFTDPAMQGWTFENDNGKCPQMEHAHFYVENWETMKVATSIQERLWELRKDKGLNLEELSKLTGISKSALGSYEKEDYKEINHGNLITLADFYGVSVDYLLCRTENREQINTPLTELHLNDEMVALLKSGRINNRLLCELATHKDFIKFLADIEIYVDGIATMQIQNLNSLVDTVRHEIIERYRPGEDDPHLKVLQAAHISDDEYFSHMVLDDLNLIIRDIREFHKKDSESAPQTTVADELKENLEAVENFKGSRDEKLVILYCKQLGINYKNLSEEEFRWFIRILKKSKKMGTPISQRKKR